MNSIKATVNDILREWRDLWPGGLREEEYSTLNLMAHCRQGALGYNQARAGGCRHQEWYASSCGNRHCPNCLGPRQAEWSEKVCERLPDCPHFHVVFTVPKEFHDFFKLNYRIAADALFGAAAETLKLFQRNNWRTEGGFLGVLHTWGRALNWHPHLHVLVSAGGRDVSTGRWRQARPTTCFRCARCRSFWCDHAAEARRSSKPIRRSAGRSGSTRSKDGATGASRSRVATGTSSAAPPSATPARWCATSPATPAVSR
ncbi:MAG: transposase zinc-binding domain-containing protein [Akkermansiaceae bacterium]|nr:transposase zinc-binding domain-containing protein [Akkermansiaceae bacterium]